MFHYQSQYNPGLGKLYFYTCREQWAGPGVGLAGHGVGLAGPGVGLAGCEKGGLARLGAPDANREHTE